MLTVTASGDTLGTFQRRGCQSRDRPLRRLEMGSARRICAAMAVVACHALLIAVVSMSYRGHSVPATSRESLLLIALPPEVTSPSTPDINRHDMQRHTVAPPTQTSDPSSPVIAERIVTTPPPVDWSAEAARAARRTLKRQTDSPLRTFGTWSRDEVIEPFGTDLAPGDTERFDDGEVRTWVNAHCYFTNRGPAEIPSGVPGAPSVWGKTLEVCQRAPRVTSRRGAPGISRASPAQPDRRN